MAGSSPTLLAWAAALLLAASLRFAAGADAKAGRPPGRWRQGSPTNILEQHLQHSTELDWTKPADGKCPSWVDVYAKFHSRMKGNPDAKYLVHSCHTGQDCHHGLGDRVRGLFPTIQLAIAHERVLLIEWASPAPLEHFLLPNQINWTITPDLGVDVAQAAPVPCCNRGSFWSNVPEDKDNRVWKISTNSLHFQTGLDPNLPKNVPTFHRLSFATHCLLAALFQPSPALLKAADAEQMKLLGSLDKPYVAVHLRMGHLEDLARGWDHFQGLLAAYQCAWKRNHLLHAPRPLKPAAPSSSPKPPKGRSTATHHATSLRQHMLLAAEDDDEPYADSAVDAAQLEARPGWEDAQAQQAWQAFSAIFSGTASVPAASAGQQHEEEQVGRALRGLHGSARALATTDDGDEEVVQQKRHHEPHKMLLLTDHTHLRMAVAHGMLAGVAGPDYLAYHISNYQDGRQPSPEDNIRTTMTTFVDLVLLARAHCLVWSPSGFPIVAMTLGFNPCTVDVPTCIDEAAAVQKQHHLEYCSV